MSFLNRVLKVAVGTNPFTSYTNLGFRVRQRLFDPSDLQVDLSGRVALITGANSGIGLATARELSRRNARVFLLCRDEARGKAALDALKTEFPRADAGLARLDISDLADVRRFASGFPEPVVDILVHNAGVLPDVRKLTAQNLELTLATDLVGPYLLTTLLTPKLAASSDARLILVSSGGMYPRRLDVATLHKTTGPFDGVTAYADAKRALVELAEHWAATLPKSITVSAMHPGWADTPAVKTSLPTFHKLSEPMLRTPEQGADTVVWLAASPKARGQTGLFWFDREPVTAHVLPWTHPPAGERAKLIAALERWVA